MNEEWLPVAGYENLYEVSSLGRVRRFRSRLMKLSNHSAGYLVLNLRKNKKTRTCYVHRLVVEAFLGVSDLFVNHKDLDKQNNYLNNLEYVTNGENLLHAFKNGVKIGKTISTYEQRIEIRLLRANGLKLKEIGKIFALSESAVSEICRGTTWAWELK